MASRRRSSFDEFPTAEPTSPQSRSYSRYASDRRRPADSGRMAGASAVGGRAAFGGHAAADVQAGAATPYSRRATQGDYTRARR